MKVLIVAATYQEIAPFLAEFELIDVSFQQHSSFDVLITGVGMTATAFALGKTLHNPYKLILNVGIAGSFNKDIKIGDLINVKEDIFADLGVEENENFLSIEELGFGKTKFEGLEIKDLKQVKGITVNKVSGSLPTINYLLKKYNPAIETMEGAAVFYCAEQAKTPVIQVRSVSNFVEPRNKENWDIKLAINNLNLWLINYLRYKI
ncbi:futalosine hydrolase [Pedobacter flavus]|uniref:Futalosine hydrolase n=1 Tax=Pedobacter flavus TaxID=3113906 RepID=A0ABU7H203_9SPHI|nr:futalosine hydrolase [Pedobacter sp. VNH31]MEE1884596.1 futalosine hydrolase [Pedobacter sp. VNH31]